MPIVYLGFKINKRKFRNCAAQYLATLCIALFGAYLFLIYCFLAIAGAAFQSQVCSIPSATHKCLQPTLITILPSHPQVVPTV